MAITIVVSVIPTIPKQPDFKFPSKPKPGMQIPFTEDVVLKQYEQEIYSQVIKHDRDLQAIQQQLQDHIVLATGGDQDKLDSEYQGVQLQLDSTVKADLSIIQILGSTSTVNATKTLIDQHQDQLTKTYFWMHDTGPKRAHSDGFAQLLPKLRAKHTEALIQFLDSARKDMGAE